MHYRSTELQEWTYEGILHRRTAGSTPIDTGRLWECPQLLRTDTCDVLLYSVQMEGEPQPLRHAVYEIGQLADDAFRSESMGLVDHGDVFYAPAITDDDTGRTLMWGWIQDDHDETEVNHRGALSLPRTLHIRDGRLVVEPARELDRLRT